VGGVAAVLVSRRHIPQQRGDLSPQGFVTDLASIPRIFWWLLPPFGKYGKAAVLHDWCYSQGIHTKLWADNIFMEAMKVLEVPSWKVAIMYRMVRWFGRGSY